MSFPKPHITINPVGEVTWGRNIAITCSISTQVLGGSFILKKTSDSFIRTQTSSTNSATFNILKVNFDNEGSYQCQYQKMGSGLEFNSRPSDSGRLSVTGNKANTCKKHFFKQNEKLSFLIQISCFINCEKLIVLAYLLYVVVIA